MSREAIPTPASAPGGGSAVRLQDVHHAYHRTVALRGLNLEVDRGEIVAITGASGSGKSTALHAITGLLRPQRGTVELLASDVAGMRAEDLAALRRRRVGIVLQFGQLVPELTALENVALPLLLDGHRRAGALRLARDWLDRCGAGDAAEQVTPELSGGQAQRVALARALITGPELVVADEPTGSLDTAAGRELLTLLVEEVRTTGAALIVVTHDNTVAAIADREVRLADGRVASTAVLR